MHQNRQDGFQVPAKTVSLYMCHIIRKITLHTINSLEECEGVNYINVMRHKLWLLPAIMIHGNVAHGDLNKEMSSAYPEITYLSALKPCELTSGCSPLPLIEFFFTN